MVLYKEIIELKVKTKRNLTNQDLVTCSLVRFALLSIVGRLFRGSFIKRNSCMRRFADWAVFRSHKNAPPNA